MTSIHNQLTFKSTSYSLPWQKISWLDFQPGILRETFTWFRSSASPAPPIDLFGFLWTKKYPLGNLSILHGTLEWSKRIKLNVHVYSCPLSNRWFINFRPWIHYFLQLDPSWFDYFEPQQFNSSTIRDMIYPKSRWISSPQIYIIHIFYDQLREAILNNGPRNI